MKNEKQKYIQPRLVIVGLTLPKLLTGSNHTENINSASTQNWISFDSRRSKGSWDDDDEWE